MFRNPTADVIVVLVIVLLFFGPKRLPALGKDLGRGMREFKDSITGKDHDDDEDEKPALTAASESPATSPAPAREPEPAQADTGSERRS
jgi:sec-independent protein translocase protein TatA